MKTQAIDKWMEVYGFEGMENKVWETITRWEEDEEWANMTLNALSAIVEHLPYYNPPGSPDLSLLCFDDWDLPALAYWQALYALAQIQQELLRLKNIEKANKRLMKKVEKLSQLSLF
jgi:hypothetical protein